MVPLNLRFVVLLVFGLCNAQNSSTPDINLSAAIDDIPVPMNNVSVTMNNDTKADLRINNLVIPPGNYPKPAMLRTGNGEVIRGAIVTRTSSTSLVIDGSDISTLKKDNLLNKWLANPFSFPAKPRISMIPADTYPMVPTNMTSLDPFHHMNSRRMDPLFDLIFTPWKSGISNSLVHTKFIPLPLKAPIQLAPVYIPQLPIYGPTDPKHLLDLLWASIILRDNIVTSFGSILYRPQSQLPEALYTSLYRIYDYVRLRRLHTTDYLPNLKNITNVSPQQQFLTIFQEFQRRLPRHLKGNADIWVEVFSKYPFQTSVRLRGELPEIDLLANLRPSQLDYLDIPVAFPKSVMDMAPENVKSQMGSMFANIFSALKQRSIDLTQPLLAVILLHLPLDEIVPQKDEVVRFLVDALRFEGIKNWPNILDQLSPEDFNSPFYLVPRVLDLIARNENDVDQIRRDAAEMIPYIKAPTDTFSNQFYQVMSPVIGSGTIEYDRLYEQVTPAEFGPDTVVLVKIFQLYVDQGYIDLDMATKGLIWYDYKTPVDLLIAILTRIIQRQQLFMDDIMSMTKALQLALIFKNHRCSMANSIPDSMTSIPTLAESMTSPALPQDVKKLGNKLLYAVMDEDMYLNNVTGKTPSANCRTPEQCFVTVMKKAIQNGELSNSKAVPIFAELMKRVDDYGKPETLKPIGCPAVSTLPSKYEEKPRPKLDAQPEFIYPTTLPPKHEVKPEFIYPTTLPSKNEVKPGIIYPFNLPSKHEVKPEFIYPTTLPSKNEVKPGIIYPFNLPSKQEVKPELIYSNSFPSKYELKPEFIYTINLPSKHEVKPEFIYPTTVPSKHEVKPEFIYPTTAPEETKPSKINLLNILPITDTTTSGLILLETTTTATTTTETPDPDVGFPPFSPDMFLAPLPFDEREDLIPPTIPFTPRDKLMKPIRNFINQPHLQEMLGPDFEPENYKTRAALLTDILKRALKIVPIKNNENLNNLYKAYLHFLNREIENNKPVINFPSLLDTIPHADNAEEFNHFLTLRDLFITGEVRKYIIDFDPSKYPTKGKLLKKILEHLLENQDVKKNKPLADAIRALKDKVNEDGPGAKSVEYALVRQTVQRRTVNLHDSLQAVDLQNLNPDEQMAMRGVYHFFEKEFQPPLHLSGFSFMDFKTRGEWLYAFFHHLVELDTVSDDAKQNLLKIIPHILQTGPGALPVD